MPKSVLVSLILVLLASAVWAGDFSVAPGGASGPAVERVAPPTYYMQDLDRYKRPRAR